MTYITNRCKHQHPVGACFFCQAESTSELSEPEKETKECALQRAIDAIDQKGGELTVINLKLTILEQKELLSAIHADLLERAETDSQGLKVVGLGDGLWQKLKRYLGE